MIDKSKEAALEEQKEIPEDDGYEALKEIREDTNE